MSGMTPWWVREPARLEREQDAMERFAAMQLTVEMTSCAWVGEVEVEGRVRRLRVEYGPGFPITPPRVWEVDEMGRKLDHRATRHIDRDDSVCLYTHDDGAHGWHRHYTAAHAVARFVEFAGLANRGGHLQIYTSTLPVIPGVATEGRVIVPASLAAAMRADDTGWVVVGSLRVAFCLGVRSEQVIWVHALTTPSGRTLLDASPAERMLLGGGWSLEACWLWLPAMPDVLRAPDADFDALVQWVAGQPRRKVGGDLASAACALVGWMDGDVPRLALYHRPIGVEGWLRAIRLQGRGLLHLPVHVLHADERLGARNQPVMSAGADEAWERVHLLMVGAGSLGSTVAVALAKAGARHFTLYDPEVLEPENVSRHVGGISALFRPKVEVVEDHIREHNPHARVACVREEAPDCSGAESAWVFREFLARPDTVLVVTTAESQSEALLNRLALEAGVPVVFGSVLGPAAHGRVFRVLPGQTPCLECVLMRQARDPEGCPRYEGGREVHRFDGDRYRRPAQAGVAIDVDRVALLVARMVLGTLSRLHPAIEYPDAGVDHLLCTQHGGWVFEDDGYGVRPVCIEREVACPACGV